jgi:hypothetical protein
MKGNRPAPAFLKPFETAICLNDMNESKTEAIDACDRHRGLGGLGGLVGTRIEHLSKSTNLQLATSLKNEHEDQIESSTVCSSISG